MGFFIFSLLIWFIRLRLLRLFRLGFLRFTFLLLLILILILICVLFILCLLLLERLWLAREPWLSANVVGRGRWIHHHTRRQRKGHHLVYGRKSTQRWSEGLSMARLWLTGVLLLHQDLEHFELILMVLTNSCHLLMKHAFLLPH